MTPQFEDLTFTVDDGQGFTGSTTLTIHITGANDTALISGTTSKIAVEAGGVNNGTLNTPVVSGTLTDTDADNPANTFQPSSGTGDNGFGSLSEVARTISGTRWS